MLNAIRSLQWRWAFPALIFGGMTLPLLILAFDNDEAMASMFHRMAYLWALAMHIAILLFPIVIAGLPRDGRLFSERNTAWSVWGLALLLALAGNVTGSIAHATGRTIPQVLGGHPTPVAGAVQLVAGAGGALIVALEFATGRLLEANIGRFLGVAPVPETASLPAVNVAGSAPELPARRKRRLPRAERQRRLNAPIGAKLGAKVPKPALTEPSIAVGEWFEESAMQELPAVRVDSSPAEISDEELAAVEAIVQHGSPRKAADAGACEGVSHETIRKLAVSARGKAPGWYDAMMEQRNLVVGAKR